MSKTHFDMQNAEFVAMADLAGEWRKLQMTPVVDDNYPYIRSGYNRALSKFLQACVCNGHFLGAPPVMPILTQVAEELERAKKFKPFNSAHGGWAVIYEEFIVELGEHVWTNQTKRDLVAMRKEAIQVAAMAVKFVEMIDADRGRV